MTNLPANTRNGDSFHMFFECWIVEQNQHLQELQELVSASKESERKPGAEIDGGVLLRPLVERVVYHYEHYYTTKSRWAKTEIISMLSPSWISTLEDAFLWIGGWRPSMAFHLLYSKSGLQLVARLDDVLRGVSTGDLGDLSPSQLVLVNELQKNTLREEKRITEKLAKRQETVAGSSIVELTHVVTQLIREGDLDRVVEQEGRMEAALAPKEEGLVGILEMADRLRMKTLKGVVDLLSPMQGVHFLIAAAELHLRVHDLGKKRDARHQQT